MRRGLALLSALCLALGAAGCGQGSERPPEATAAPEYYDAGTEAAARGDYAAAVDAFSRAIEADDDRAAAYAGRADCYLALARQEETEPGPDLRGLALRDHEIALELDPALGPHIYEVYADLGAEALAAGSTAEGLCCLHMALAAAPDGEGEELLGQVRELTDGILTGSVWYMDAPDSRYYEFFNDGTGRIVDAVTMEAAGDLAYENEGFALSVTEDGGTERWTYEPERESYYTAVPTADGETLPLRLTGTSPRRMYAQWQAAILGSEAELRVNGNAEEDPAVGYGALYEREYALLEALAVTRAGALTEEDDAVLSAERERRELLRADMSAAQEAFGQLRETVDGLIKRLPDTASGEGSALAEIFPVGERTLLDYLRLIVGWAMNGQTLTVRGGAEALTRWESLRDVDHYFQDGRLYLRLNGYVRRDEPLAALEGLVPDEHGRFSLETPLTFGDDVTLTGQALLSRLQGDSWVSLWALGYGTEVFFLELDLADDMTCTGRGGYYPGEMTGRQSGEYALEGDQLTLTLAADGYSPGTYRYEVLPMGDSLYMTLLTDGIVYGQTAGSTYVFCGGGYAEGVRSRLG